jgi:hypothetical protein
MKETSLTMGYCGCFVQGLNSISQIFSENNRRNNGFGTILWVVWIVRSNSKIQKLKFQTHKSQPLQRRNQDENSGRLIDDAIIPQR